MSPKAAAAAGQHPPARRPPDPSSIREAHRHLLERFGPLAEPRRLDPLEELVLTVLSQNTSDVNRDRAYAAMRRRFRSWRAIARASEQEVAAAIRVGGLANTKAPRIQAILRAIEEREGTLSLERLRELSDREVGDYLTTLPGVGPKTAACVLAFSLGRAALPVDTHVFRVAGRLGYLPEGVSAAAAHDVMEALVPPRMRVSMHIGLIRLGREICKAGRPRCEVCPLQDLCPTAPTILRGLGVQASTPRRAARRPRT